MPSHVLHTTKPYDWRGYNPEKAASTFAILPIIRTMSKMAE